MPLNSIEKKRKFVARRHFTYAAEGNASMPHQKSTEFWVGGHLNTYNSGPKKGEATGTCSILFNPSEGMNKMTPQLVEPYAFGETVKSASASLSPRTPLSHTTASTHDHYSSPCSGHSTRRSTGFRCASRRPSRPS
jgi:hypothetical protein